jgi:hypothetical protein
MVLWQIFGSCWSYRSYRYLSRYFSSEKLFTIILFFMIFYLYQFWSLKSRHLLDTKAGVRCKTVKFTLFEIFLTFFTELLVTRTCVSTTWYRTVQKEIIAGSDSHFLFPSVQIYERRELDTGSKMETSWSDTPGQLGASSISPRQRRCHPAAYHTRIPFLLLCCISDKLKTRRLFIEKMGVVEEKKGRHRSRSRERKRSRERGGASRSKSREKKKVRIKNSDVLDYIKGYLVPLESSAGNTITAYICWSISF